jgi:hypothetical protein
VRTSRIPPHVARLNFVLKFSQLDLTALDGDAWLDLQDKIIGFLALGTAQRLESGQDQPGTDLPLPRAVRLGYGLELSSTVRVDLSHATCAVLEDGDFPLERDLVRQVQDEVREMLKAARTPHLVPPKQWAPLQMRVSHSTLDLHPGAGRGTVRHIRATPRDAFLFLVSEILTHEATDRIARCPVCPTLFYRAGRMRYCSGACANRANVRQWRYRHKARLADGGSAHTLRASATTTPVGAGVKRRGRPRKTRP